LFVKDEETSMVFNFLHQFGLFFKRKGRVHVVRAKTKSPARMWREFRGEAGGFCPILATHINSASAAPARKVQRGFRHFPFPKI
jgi:hypothetical protein